MLRTISWLVVGALALQAHAASECAIATHTLEYLPSPVMGAPAAPRSSWTLKTPDQTHGTTQATYTLTFTSKAKGQVWTSGVVNSTDNNLVPFGGSPLGSDQDFEVLLDATTSDGCKATSTLSFRTGLQERADWHGKWIAGAKSAQNTTNNQLRKEFKLSADAVTRASLFISGIGYYELLCNGQNIDPSRALDVGWTDYAKRVYYSTFDVASCLVEGDNVLAVTLGNSWFSCGNPGAPTTQPGCIDAPPQLLVQLNIEQGGQATEVVSDETWATAAGPVTYDSLYNGEHYDARLETTGWAPISKV